MCGPARPARDPGSEFVSLAGVEGAVVVPGDCQGELPRALRFWIGDEFSTSSIVKHLPLKKWAREKGGDGAGSGERVRDEGDDIDSDDRSSQ